MSIPSDFIEVLEGVFGAHARRPAFVIAGRTHSYEDLGRRVAWIRELMDAHSMGSHVGIWLSDQVESYAAILAMWLSGRAFIPLSPLFPKARNQEILDLVKPAHVLHASAEDPGREFEGTTFVSCVGESERQLQPERLAYDPGKLAYVLFTSGSTGRPKGVKISYGNLDAFLKGFFLMPGLDLNATDRALQINDLTFDGALSCWLPPLLRGACIYTVASGAIKYLEAYKLMKEEHLTYIKMPPSTLHFLRPYFSEIHLPGVRFCFFGGEALPEKLLKEFVACVPAAQIRNVYGPTEATVSCASHDWSAVRGGGKAYRGVVSIGRALGQCQLEVRAEDGRVLGPGEEGELWIGGPQLAQGYWGEQGLGEGAFLEGFYRSGDRVLMDPDGDLMFLGRVDRQVQVQGFRVELGEVEARAREVLDSKAMAAFAMEARQGGTEIVLALEGREKGEERQGLLRHLQNRLPAYMLPARIEYLSVFPRLVSGKVDLNEIRNALH